MKPFTRNWLLSAGISLSIYFLVLGPYLLIWGSHMYPWFWAFWAVAMTPTFYVPKQVTRYYHRKENHA